MNSAKVNPQVVLATAPELETPFSEEIYFDSEGFDYSFPKVSAPSRDSVFGSTLAAFGNAKAFLASRSR